MTSLLRASEETQTRILSGIGCAFAIVVAASIAIWFMIHSGGRNPSGIISVTIDTPYVGEGVVAGTSVIMHGVKMGEVAAISRQPGGHVVLTTNLQAAPAVGLTDAMGIDFRPSNYFGVTGINLLPADTGQPLHDGIRLEITPKGNFALQTLLYQLGTLTNHVITQQLVDVIERTTRYTDALNPLLETMITVSTTVANVQTVGTAQLLRNATGINVALPGFVDALISTGDMYLHTKVGTAFNADEERTSNPFVGAYDSALLNQYNGAVALLASNPDEFVFGRLREWLKGAETDLFSKVGHLESSHVYELFPVVEEIRTLTDTIPKLIPAQDISNTLREVRERLERMYAGSGEQRALQVRLILDELPGLASPLGLALEAAG